MIGSPNSLEEPADFESAERPVIRYEKPGVIVEWYAAPPLPPAVKRRLLEILFSPPTRDASASEDQAAIHQGAVLFA